MNNSELYEENPSIFQKFIALTNQKEILVSKVCKKIQDNYISKELSLLDIGCADGMVTLQIIDRLKQLYKLDITCIETSKELLDQFKARTDYDINFINESVELLGLLPKSDFILMAHVMSYINNVEDFLDKIMSSLNSDGMALIVVSNKDSDDKKVKDSLNSNNNSISAIVRNILDKKKIKYDVEIVESEIDASGLEEMNEKGKTIIEFLKHKRIEDISTDEINDIRNKLLNLANEKKKIIKREDYIWIKK